MNELGRIDVTITTIEPLADIVKELLNSIANEIACAYDNPQRLRRLAKQLRDADLRVIKNEVKTHCKQKPAPKKKIKTVKVPMRRT